VIGAIRVETTLVPGAFQIWAAVGQGESAWGTARARCIAVCPPPTLSTPPSSPPVLVSRSTSTLSLLNRLYRFFALWRSPLCAAFRNLRVALADFFCRFFELPPTPPEEEEEDEEGIVSGAPLPSDNPNNPCEQKLWVPSRNFWFLLVLVSFSHLSSFIITDRTKGRTEKCVHAAPRNMMSTTRAAVSAAARFPGVAARGDGVASAATTLMAAPATTFSGAARGWGGGLTTSSALARAAATTTTTPSSTVTTTTPRRRWFASSSSSSSANVAGGRLIQRFSTSSASTADSNYSQSHAEVLKRAGVIPPEHLPQLLAVGPSLPGVRLVTWTMLAVIKWC
jgi:hypothetical protein